MLLAARWIAIVIGFLLLFLIWLLPKRIGRMINRADTDGTESVRGHQSPKETLHALITAFLLIAAASFAAASAVFVVSPFQGTGETLAILWGLLAYPVFLFGLLITVHFFLTRPLSGTVSKLNSAYLSMRFMLLGLALTMFTAALILMNL